MCLEQEIGVRGTYRWGCTKQSNEGLPLVGCKQMDQKVRAIHFLLTFKEQPLV